MVLLGPWLDLVGARTSAAREASVDIPRACEGFILPTPLKDAELAPGVRALLKKQ